MSLTPSALSGHGERGTRPATDFRRGNREKVQLLEGTELPNPAAETEHLQTELCYDKSAASAKGRQRGKRFPGLEKERLLSEQRRRRCPRVRPRHRVGRLQRSSPQLRAPKSCLQGLWRGSESAGLGLWGFGHTHSRRPGLGLRAGLGERRGEILAALHGVQE